MSIRSHCPRALAALVAEPGGAAAVEFAFALPILIALTLGTCEIGYALYTQAHLDHAVKETARFASVRGLASGVVITTVDLEDMAMDLARVDPASLSADVTWQPDNRPGSTVTVRLDHTYTPLTAVLFTDGGFTMSSTASMTVVR